MIVIATGAGGQVGTALIGEAERRGIAYVGLTRNELDITDQGAIAAALLGVGRHVDTAARRAPRGGVAQAGKLSRPDRLGRHGRAVAPKPDVVLNLAAYNAVDAAEEDPEPAFRVNAAGVETLARACADFAVPLLHVSTDYVFDGTLNRPYRETDAVHPVNAYGRSKAAGEDAVRRALDRHMIVRTTWLFGGGGKNFVTTLLRLARQRSEVTVVTDESGCPTGVTALAATLLTLAEWMTRPGFDDWGTYHYCGRPVTSRADFARAIYDAARRHGLPAAQVKDVTTAEFGSPAPRPPYTALDCERIERVFGITQPDWRVDLERMIGALARADAQP